jgi:hypothetical protein
MSHREYINPKFRSAVLKLAAESYIDKWERLPNTWNGIHFFRKKNSKLGNEAVVSFLFKPFSKKAEVVLCENIVLQKEQCSTKSLAAATSSINDLEESLRIVTRNLLQETSLPSENRL